LSKPKIPEEAAAMSGLASHVIKPEKAVKALHLRLGQEAWGHVVARLLRALPMNVDQRLIEAGQVVDNFYIPSRYPNSHAEGAPFEHYGPRQSEEAILSARAIVDFVRAEMA
jgi:HEPN domain-containing protein